MVAPFQYSGFVSVMFTYPMWDLKTSIFFNDVIDFRRSRYAFHWHAMCSKHWIWLVYRYFHVWSSMPRSTTLLSSLIGVNLLHHSTYHGMFGSTYGETAFIAYTVDMQLLVEAELVVGITQKRKREEISSRVPLVLKNTSSASLSPQL